MGSQRNVQLLYVGYVYVRLCLGYVYVRFRLGLG